MATGNEAKEATCVSVDGEVILLRIGGTLADMRKFNHTREICIGNSGGSSLNARICRLAEYLCNCDEKFAASESLLAKKMGISVEALNEAIEAEGDSR